MGLIRLVQSNAFPNGSMIHMGVEKEVRGEVTGTVFRTYTVTACKKRQLGGAYGADIWNGLACEISCPSCAAIAAKVAA